MITWNEFLLFSLPAVALWASGALLAWKQKRNTAILLTLAGTVVFAAFIAGLWIGLERPPLRTMGETRLWYSFFMPVAGIITYWRWRFKWVLSFSTVMSVVFVCIRNGYDRQFGEHRLGFYHYWHAVWRCMGKRCLGTLLELGPERNVGCGNVVHLSALCSSEARLSVEAQGGSLAAGCWFRVPANVLVGYQLSAFGSRCLNPHLQSQLSGLVSCAICRGILSSGELATTICSCRLRGG